MNPFRDLPSVTHLLEFPALVEARARHPHDALVEAARAELDALRAQIASQESVDPDSLPDRILARLDASIQPRLKTVINATGIVLHTNLGRAPMHEDAARAAYDAACNYSNLELDLATGNRGSRQDAVRDGIRHITRADNATAVNNCAAATVLVLRALAAGKEVIVSRGQLIEIGGSFRIPEIMAASGAILKEVGTTNITRLADYERAIGPHTAALMRVHTSNYRIEGFTQTVELAELAALAKKHNLIAIDDAGSGQAIDLTPFGLPGEPLVSAGIAAGADLVLFSGDKLLGGPQAGIIAGRAVLIHRIEKDPLMRAFRLDKMAIAALEATLRLYRDPSVALQEIPVLRMLSMPAAELKTRAEAFAARLRTLPGIKIAVQDDLAFAGGGSLPEIALPTTVIAIQADDLSESAFASRLRVGSRPVMARLQDRKVLIDLRTVLDGQESELLEAIRAATSPPVE